MRLVTGRKPNFSKEDKVAMGNLKLLATVGLAGLMGVFGAGPALAQEEVRLSAVELVESKNTIDHITQTDFERKTATNLWEALKGSLGVYQQISGSRGESYLSIRGSSREQVGLFIDDIPIASTYRNEWDANNFMLFDLDSIEVSKGFSSPLLSSNSGLAGVVNLRTAKPVKELEFSAKYLNFFDRNLDDQGRLFAASVGTKQDLFYLKTSVAYKGQDFFTLPSSFTPGINEDGGRRENSDSKNKALNIIAGWTPTDDVDIMFGFMRQSYEKGQPFDAAQNSRSPGEAEGGPTQQWDKYVRWPEYETERYYVNGNVNLSEKAHLKAVAYYDGHKDTSSSYSDTTLSKPFYARNYKQAGTYDQFTAGGQLTFDYTFNPANKLAVSAGYRRLSHKQYQEGLDFPNSNKPLDMHATEDNYDFGAEYTLKPMEPLTLVFGATYTYLTPKTLMERQRPPGNSPPTNPSDGSWGMWRPMFESDEPGNQGLFDYQIGAFYDLTENHELFATFAHKSRFANMRQRYGRINDITVPSGDTLSDEEKLLIGTPSSPDLKPEKSFNYELGYRGLIQDWLKINASLYYREVSDVFASKDVYTSDKHYYGSTINADKAKFHGFELGAEAFFSPHLSAGLVFNYLDWTLDTINTKATDNTLLTGLPKFTSTVYAVVSPLEGLSIIPQINMSSNFYWSEAELASNNRDPQGLYKESPGFATADLKVVYDLNEYLTFELGAKNLFDKEYAYSAYYPEPGRNFFLGVTGRY
jgi:iron complex outermembrane receptor protein